MTPVTGERATPVASRIGGTIRFTVPGEPVPKARPRWAPRGNTYTAPRTVAAEEKVRQYLKVTYPALRPAYGAFRVEVAFHAKNTGRGDVDNYLKLILDALTGCIWINDRQVRSVEVALLDHSAEPRTQVVVYEILSYEMLESAAGEAGQP